MPIIQYTATPEDPKRVIERLSDRRFIIAELENVLNSAIRIGEQSIRLGAPHGKTGELERHVDSTKAHYGAGGELEAAAGVRPIPGGDPRRGLYPDIGTGIYGPRHTYIYAARGLHSPHSGLFMVFDIDGRKIVTTRVKGQKPQHFVRHAFRDVEEYLPQRLELAAERIVHGPR